VLANDKQGEPVTVASSIASRTVALGNLAIEIPGIWENPREFSGLDASEIKELGASIRDKGLIDPPKVQMVRNLDGRVIELVIDGQRRKLAADSVLDAATAIPVIDLSDEVMDLTPENVDKLMLMALTTYEREDLSSYELSTVAHRMKDRGKTLDYIGKAIGRDASWVSKMLKARGTASKKLLTQWRKGEITDEQFKDLAAVADPDEQDKAAKTVVDTRKSGDKAEARVKAKEIAASAKKNGKASVAPVVRGPQEGLPGVEVSSGNTAKNESKAEKPQPPKMRNRAVLDDLLHMTDKRPPTSEIVKGIVLGVQYACGLIEADDFGKAWQQYVNRVEGRPAKPPRKVKAAKAAKPVKAKPSKSTKAKKSGKKSKAKK
jgi:ParB-like chromosome segregation protein Spo0J